MKYFGLEFKDYLEKFDEIGYVDQVVHSVIYVEGLPSVSPHEVIIFEKGGLGEVLSLTADYVEVLPFFRDRVTGGDRVTRTGRVLEVPVGPGLLGKTISPLGEIITGTGGIDHGQTRPVDTLPLGILDRSEVTEALEVGVSLVDLGIPLGKGQRELVIGDRKTGKSAFLLQAVYAQAKKGAICVYAAIGKKRSDIKKIQDYFTKQKITANAVVVASTSEDPTGVIFITPYTAMTISEYFRDQGRDVVLILDDMTNHARFYREITLLAQRFPGRSSYPGDIFYIHAKLLERAGKFPKGSITCFPVAETMLGDLSGYIQTNLMAMTDGHIFFDSELANLGRRPAINPFLSVTRVGLQAQTPLMKDANRELSRFLIHLDSLRQFMHFGAELNETIKKTLDLGDKLIAFFNTPTHVVVPAPVSLFIMGSLWASYWGTLGIPEMEKETEMILKSYDDPNFKQRIDTTLAKYNRFNDLVAGLKEDTSIIDLIRGMTLTPTPATQGGKA